MDLGVILGPLGVVLVTRLEWGHARTHSSRDDDSNYHPSTLPPGSADLWLSLGFPRGFPEAFHRVPRLPPWCSEYDPGVKKVEGRFRAVSLWNGLRHVRDSGMVARCRFLYFPVESSSSSRCRQQEYLASLSRLQSGYRIPHLGLPGERGSSGCEAGLVLL